MNYEMIVLDLDGTLTNSEKKMTPKTKKALMQAQLFGKIVVLASGRPTGGVTALADELRLDEYGGYILPFNGGRIIHYGTGAQIRDRFVPEELTSQVFQEAVRMNLAVMTYTDSEILSGWADNRYVELEAFINQMPVRKIDNFTAFVDFPVNKFLLAGDPEEILKAQDVMKALVGDRLNVFRSEPFFLELMPPGIDKAASVRELAESIGLTMEQVICCGDGFNDLSMIQAAGLGVAMSNAQEIVKESADYITSSNNEDGIAEVVYKFMLEQN